MSSYYDSRYLLGQIYSLDMQCRKNYGPNANYASCYVPNDSICQSLYCSPSNNSPCSTIMGKFKTTVFLLEIQII